MFKIRHSCAAQDRIKTLTSLEPLGCSRKHLPEMSGSPYLKKCPQNFLENILIVFPVPELPLDIEVPVCFHQKRSYREYKLQDQSGISEFFKCGFSISLIGSLILSKPLIVIPGQ